MEVVAHGVTDVGCKREHNEDYMLVDEQLGLFLVCDGMGGALAGEVASQRCTEIVHDLVRQNGELIRTFDAQPDADNRRALCQMLESAIQSANAEIYKMSAQDPSKRGMGTTIVLLVVAGENAVAAHVGDSRIYLLRDEQIHQLTEDHSLIAEQLRRGLINQEEAEASSFGNVIMRAVGTREMTQVDTLHMELMPGDRFVLCSDGLSGPVKSPDIGSVLGLYGPRPAAENLVTMARDAGGPDNITAICVLVADDCPTTAEIPVAYKVDMLKQIPLFSHMTYKELMTLLDIISERDYPARETIIEEGALEDEFFVLLKGKACVTKQRRQLAELETGAHFGEMCLLDDAPRSATVVCEEDCRVMVVRRGDLYPLLQREPQLAVKLLWAFGQELIGRLRDTSAELSGAQRKMERILANAQLPFATTPGIDAVPTRQGMAAVRDQD
jgi:serine/threonine protein phosphatase PrpC/CRP-like cAMP-binding protein